MPEAEIASPPGSDFIEHIAWATLQFYITSTYKQVCVLGAAGSGRRAVVFGVERVSIDYRLLRQTARL